MIENLAGTTRANQEQDWLNSNMARFTGMLQGLRDLETVSRLIMSELTPLLDAQHGTFFMREGEGDDDVLRLIATYGYKERKNVPNRFTVGEGLVGQAALEQKSILITEAPEDYIKITSGLGSAAPVNLIVLPVLFEDHVMAVIELASFPRFTPVECALSEELLQTQQEELQQTNQELEEKAQLLEEQNRRIEIKNREIELARRVLEEKAEQLALS